MIGLYISCTGKVIICQMDIPTKFEELNEQIISVFNSLGDWKPGILNGKEVDSTIEYRFIIKKGVVSFI